jgi:putative ABC transport system substrate-binding protein
MGSDMAIIGARSLGILTTSGVIILAALTPSYAQQRTKIPKIGILSPSIIEKCGASHPIYGAFLQSLRDLGYVEDRTVTFECRSVEYRPERALALAAELVAAKVDLIWTTDCGYQFHAARQATSTIPIIVALCNEDIVEMGIVKSLARPSGNITGLSKVTPELTAKRLELLKEMLPDISRVAVLWKPGPAVFTADWVELRTAAKELNLTLQSVEVEGPNDFEGAFSRMVRERTDAFMTFSDPLSYNYERQIIELAVKSRLPGTSPFREFPDAGGLMAYGPNLVEMARYSATYVDKIIKGTKAGDLPIEQWNKYELIINLRTAKTLGITVPTSMLLRATRVIE